jgi:hypothetical protein
MAQASALSRWPHSTGFAEGQAIEFMGRTILANPGEVILLAIGPLPTRESFSLPTRKFLRCSRPSYSCAALSREGRKVSGQQDLDILPPYAGKCSPLDEDFSVGVRDEPFIAHEQE